MVFLTKWFKNERELKGLVKIRQENFNFLEKFMQVFVYFMYDHKAMSIEHLISLYI